MFRIKDLPPLLQLLDELPIKEPGLICGHLGVTTQTLRQWKKDGTAPRVAQLALFYETWRGANLVHTQADNDARRLYGQVKALEKTLQETRHRLAMIEALGTHGAANEPFTRPEAPPTVAQTLYEAPHGRTVMVSHETAIKRAGWA